MKLLFVCMQNRFRSRVAKAYFDKLNKNKNIKTDSAGLIIGLYPLNPNQVKAAKKLGVTIKGRPKSLSVKLLKETDVIVITADNVPKEIFKVKGKYPQKMIVWNIKDVKTGKDMEDNERRIKQVMKKVESLVKKLEKTK